MRSFIFTCETAQGVHNCVSLLAVGKPCCSAVELIGPKPESAFHRDDLKVGSDRPGDNEMIIRCRLDR